jgi:DNA gyrase subunit A
VRAVSEIEPMANGKQRIVVTEIPYMVNKARLIEKIAELVKDKKIDGITDLRDESDRTGMRICIELRRDVNANVILNQLYKHTQLQDTFGVIMLALHNNEPKIMNLHEMLTYYLEHQKEVVTRRTQYELNKAEERAHILEGLLIAQDHIDEVIKIIRGAANISAAKLELMEKFGLSDTQAQAIVDMRLRALNGLEHEKLQKEYEELLEKIKYLKEIIADEKILLGVIRDEILLIREKYGDERRTSIEDMIPKENTIITMTKMGYIKRMTEDNFKAQNRGGKGIKGMQTINDDYIERMMMAGTHDYIMFFTSKGRVFGLKAYEIPESSRTARGTAIVNLLQIETDEKITAVIKTDAYHEYGQICMATKQGIVKKTDIREYKNIRKKGLAAISLKENDELIEVKFLMNPTDIFLITKKGQCIRFSDEDIRKTGRVSMGVIGIKLDMNDEVVTMQTRDQGEQLLIISEKGMGKRTNMDEFKAQNRGGKGVRCYKIIDKTGDVIGAKAINEDDEIMMITTEGIIIRTSVNGISVLGRSTSGVKVMNVGKSSTVASIARVIKEESEMESDTAEE